MCIRGSQWTLVYLLQHPDWQGEGILVDKRGLQGTVILPELGLEPTVHLPGDLPLDTRLVVQLRSVDPVSYTHLRAHETVLDLVCRLLLEKKKT